MLLESFARFYSGVFPSIEPELRDTLRAAVRQFGDIPADLFASQPPNRIAQGDVIGPLPFVMEHPDGRLFERRVFGMLVSQSCDFDEDRTVLFAPAFPYAELKDNKNASSIRANEVTTLFFLPGLLTREAIVIDFRHMQPFSKQRIADKFASGIYSQLTSFTDLGWYLLLAKLTLHFLRPQTADDIRGPSVPTLAERAEYVLGQVPALVRYLAQGRE